MKALFHTTYRASVAGIGGFLLKTGWRSGTESATSHFLKSLEIKLML